MDLEVVRKLVVGELPDLWALYLYGSLARPQPPPEADLDLAVLGPKPFKPQLLWSLAECIALQVHRDVDLVDCGACPYPCG